MYSINEFTERVTFVRYAETPDDTGTLAPRTQTVLASDVRALVRPMSGRERDRARQTEHRANYLVVVRNSASLDLAETDYVIWRGSEMNIRFPKGRGPRPRFLEIEAELNAP